MMSLSVAKRIQRAAQPQQQDRQSPVPAFRELAYDYTNQAWIVNGVYQSCGHPKPCTCFGTVHTGEKPQANADIH